MTRAAGVAVSASLWSADLANLERDLRAVEPYCDSFHLDIMDGHYVPNLLFGPDQVARLRALSSRPFQLHLMVRDADRMVQLFLPHGDVFILHRETCRDWRTLAGGLREAGKRVGVAVRVDEPWRDLLDDLALLDVILVMGTELGIKGVGIAPSVYRTIQQLRAALAALPDPPLVQADGGIRDHTVPRLRTAGVDAVTAGSLLFGGDPARLHGWLRTL